VESGAVARWKGPEERLTNNQAVQVGRGSGHPGYLLAVSLGALFKGPSLNLPA
jgi:hypothetical protein